MGLPFQEGGMYLLSSVVKAGKSEYAGVGNIIVTTEPIRGVTYRAMFSQAGESMNGRVVRCILCRQVVE